MNLLITSIEKPSTMPLVYSLRKRFSKIIATYNASKANKYQLKSKYIHDYVAVKVPMTNWLTCNINNDTSAEEEEYIDSLLEICATYNINVIFPCPSEVDIYLLSKYKVRLENGGIVLIVPEFPSWLSAANKLLSVQLADECDFPVPQTFPCRSFDEVLFAANEIGYPLIIKSIFSTGSIRVKFVENEDALVLNYKKLAIFGKDLLIQEFIPGEIEQSLNYVLDKDGNPIVEFALRKLRYLNPSASTCIQIDGLEKELRSGRELIKRLKLYNIFVAIQIKLDASDGIYKFIEINPRFGFNSRIVLNMGKNIAESILGLNMGLKVDQYSFKKGKTGISVVEDLFALKNYIKLKRRRSEPVEYKKIFTSYLNSYLALPRLDLHFVNFLRDPSACLGYYMSINELMNEECENFISLINS